MYKTTSYYIHLRPFYRRVKKFLSNDSVVSRTQWQRPGYVAVQSWRFGRNLRVHVPRQQVAGERDHERLYGWHKCTVRTAWLYDHINFIRTYYLQFCIRMLTVNVSQYVAIIISRVLERIRSKPSFFYHISHGKHTSTQVRIGRYLWIFYTHRFRACHSIRARLRQQTTELILFLSKVQIGSRCTEFSKPMPRRLVSYRTLLNSISYAYRTYFESKNTKIVFPFSSQQLIGLLTKSVFCYRIELLTYQQLLCSFPKGG